MRSLGLALILLGLQGSENPVDRHIEPATPCDEPDFLRRATLDLTGVVPRVEDVKAYLAKPDREKLVDRLLAGEEFDAWWARFLIELTTERRAAQYDAFNGRHFYDWLRAELKKRRPYDEIVREILMAKGNGEESPQVNFLLRYNVRPSDVTGAIGRAFLGTKLQCAQCHDHPFDRFTQEEFWGVAAFFARTKRYFIEDSDVAGVTDVKRARMEMPDDNEGNPEKPKIVVKPRWIGAKEAEAPKETREDLAKFVTSDPLFAKNLVNRVWARLMGRGLVEPLDNFGAKAKPSNPGLLDALTRHFVKSGHDLRSLVRVIVTSKEYQRKSAPLRPLSVDQLFLSLARATRFGLDEDGSGEGEEEGEEAVEYADYYPPELLGGSPRSLRRALALLNHGDLHYAVDSGARFIMKTLGKPVTMEHYEYIYLSLLSRRPTDAERKLFTGEKRWDLEDVLWAVINSVEFQNNH